MNCGNCGPKPTQCNCGCMCGVKDKDLPIFKGSLEYPESDIPKGALPKKEEG